MRSVWTKFRREDLVFLILAAVLSGVYVLSAGPGFPLDDSWIHQVYGRNLAQTGIWSFVPGIPSAASTSPLYTVLLSVGYRLNIPFGLWTPFLGVVALWVTAMLGARLVERLLPGRRYAFLIGGVAQVGTWHLIWAAVSGMETGLFAMWTLALIALAWREGDGLSSATRLVALRGGFFGLVSGLAVVTRPEGLVMIGLIGLLMVIAQMLSRQAMASQPTTKVPMQSLTAETQRTQRNAESVGYFQTGGWRGLFIWGGAAAVVFMVVLTPYLILNLQITGGLLPDTAAAKTAQNAPLLKASFPSRVVSMVTPLVAGTLLFLIPGIVGWTITQARQMTRGSVLVWLPLLWGIGLIGLYAARLPAYYHHGRYVIPALPVFIVLGTVGTLELLQAGRRTMAGRVLSRTLAVSTALAYVYFALVAGRGVYVEDVTIINEEMVTAAHWIKDHIPPDQLLAIHDIGAVGYFAARPIVDLAGLVSPEVIPFINDEESLWSWLKGYDAKFLMAFPDQIPGDNAEDSRLCLVYTTNGPTARSIGGPNMAVYALTWDGVCPKVDSLGEAGS
ncbi:MAG: hypothetical protein JNM70_08970 [Anaerolineae bacterium]|nr:hypothetical protein [Anaerolineae bacterium]